MITAAIAFLSSPLGKIVGIVAAVVAVLGLAWGMLKIHDSGVRNEALAKFNSKQLEQVAKDQEKFNKLQNDIKDAQEKIIKDLEKQNREIIAKYSDIDRKIKSPEVQKDSKPLSPKLQDIYDNIRGSSQ